MSFNLTKRFRVLLLAVAILASDRLAPAEAADKQPKTVVAQREVDLGRVREGDVVSATFVIENKGEADLIIRDVSASCGCTIPRKLTPDEKKVEPGESVKIVAKFNSANRMGKQRKTVNVYTNDPNEPNVKLFLRAEVVQLFEMLVSDRPTRRYSFGSIRPGESLTQSVDILPTEPGQNLEIISIDLRQPEIIHTLKPFQKDDRTGQSIQLSLSDNASIGRISTSIVVTAQIGDETAESSLALNGDVVGVLTFRPLVVKRLHAGLPGTSLAPVSVSSSGRVPFEILGADAGSNLEAEVKKDSPSGYTIKLKIREDAAYGPFGATLVVRTNMVEQPVIRVPIFANVRPPVETDPPIVYLDSTKRTHRVVKFETYARDDLKLVSADSDSPYVTVEISPERVGSLAFVTVSAAENAPPGEHTAMIVVGTNVAGAEKVSVAVLVRVR